MQTSTLEITCDMCGVKHQGFAYYEGWLTVQIESKESSGLMRFDVCVSCKRHVSLSEIELKLVKMLKRSKS